MIRKSFVFYASFLDAIALLDDKQQLVMYNAICLYAIRGKEPKKLSVIEKSLFISFKAQIDANNKRYANGQKGASFGKLGGAPKGNKNALKKNNLKKQPKKTTLKNSCFVNNSATNNYNEKTTPKQPQNNPKTTPNVNNNVNDNVKNNRNYFFIEKEKEKENATEWLKLELEKFKQQYDATLLANFYSYWTEPTRARDKVRFELQPTWDTARRLQAWQRKYNEIAQQQTTKKQQNYGKNRELLTDDFATAIANGIQLGLSQQV